MLSAFSYEFELLVLKISVQLADGDHLSEEARASKETLNHIMQRTVLAS